jgi:ABC-type multidrug transport system ATPase subunit
MGSSGAGKTTLLNILAGKIQPAANKFLSGDILYNGSKLDNNEISDTIGFVMQSDIFMENLTPQGTNFVGEYKIIFT